MGHDVWLIWFAGQSESVSKPEKLNGTLEEKHKTKKILDEQQRKLQVNLRRCQVEMEKCTREHDALNSKIEELELYDDSSQRELKRNVSPIVRPGIRGLWSVQSRSVVTYSELLPIPDRGRHFVTVMTWTNRRSGGPPSSGLNVETKKVWSKKSKMQWLKIIFWNFKSKEFETVSTIQDGFQIESSDWLLKLDLIGSICKPMK